MQGLGNDYIYVDGSREKVADKVNAAIKLSDRHFGIGADGLIFINPSDKADFEMEMYNADGSRSQMCGNGIRCVAKYVYDMGLTDKRTVDIETLAGVKRIELTVDEAVNKVTRARVNMGSPVFEPDRVPCLPQLFEGYGGGIVKNLPLQVGDRSFKTTCISMGNPHAIVFIDEDPGLFPLEQYGPLFENHRAFPERVNAEFVKVLDRTRLSMRVWERGTGETMACGTGATAVAVAAMLNGYADSAVSVLLPGGELFIEWAKSEGAPAFMTGAAATVFTGETEL